MANNYTLFATTFTPMSEEQTTFILAALAVARGEESALTAWLEENNVEADDPTLFLSGISHTYCPAKGGERPYIYFASEECGSLEDLAQLIAAAQRKFPEDTLVWHAASASTCSAMRVEEFGGYAVCVHRGTIARISTTQWMNEQAHKFLGQEKAQDA